MISKMITIKGDKVQNVGYRPFLLENAVRLKIKNFDAMNVESEDEADNEKQILIVYISGEDKQITDFVEFVQSKKGRPRKARVDSVVQDIYIEDVISIEEYKSILSAEQQSRTVQGCLLIGDILVNDTNKCLNLLRKETTENFDRMDTKYEAISRGMFLLADKIDKRMEKLEERWETTNARTDERNKIVDMRIEKMDKHIEVLLELLAEQKKQE